MALLQDLPAELLSHILVFLAHADLHSLILAQSTSKRFHAAIHSLLLSGSHPGGTPPARAPAPPPPTINPLWHRFFPGLTNSADCFTPSERRSARILTLDGDPTLPFRRFPWAADPTSRAPFLRPDATWRNLSLTFGTSPITHLDLIRDFTFSSTGAGQDLTYLQLADLSSTTTTTTTTTGGSYLTAGTLYDLLLLTTTTTPGVTFGAETGSWALLPGRRVASFDRVLECECFLEDDEAMVDSRSAGAARSAVLYVRGGDGCYPHSEILSDAWRPAVLGDVPPVVLAWQGPENRRPSV